MKRKSRKSRNREMKTFIDMLKKISLSTKKASDSMRNVATILNNAAKFIDSIENMPKIPKLPKCPTDWITRPSIADEYNNKSGEPITLNMPTDWDIDINKK